MSLQLNLYENLSLLNETGLTTSKSVEFYVVSGSRLLVDLLVTALDPGVTVQLDIGNTFSPADGYNTVSSITTTATGSTKKVITDFHNQFLITATVTGGAATFKVGIAVFDNAGLTTITDPTIDVAVNHTSDSIRLGDGVRLTSVTSAGELKVHDQDVLDALSALDLVIEDSATATKQDVGNASLASIDSKLSGSLAVTGTFWQTIQPISGIVTVSNFPATQPISATALPLPSNAAQETGGHLASIDAKLGGSLAVTGPLTDAQLRATAVPVSASALPLPAGAATSALQTTGNTSLASILSALGSPFQAGGSIANTAFIANAGTNLNTSALAVESGGHLASIDAKVPALGQALAASSVPVVLTAAQLTTLTPLATVAVTQSTSPWVVSAGSLPLPAGASTAALQTAGNASLASLVSALTNPLPVSGTFWQTTQPVSLASLPALTAGTSVIGHVIVDSAPTTAVTGPLTDTQLRATAVPISAAALPLPTGAATLAKQPALGVAGTASTDVITIQGIAAMTPIKTDGSGVTQPVSGSISLASATSATCTNVSVLNSNTTLMASNASRKMASIYNDGGGPIYVKLGATASATSFTLILNDQDYYELPLPIYTGIIDAISASGTRTARVTEY